MDKQLLVLIVAGILLLVVAVQAFQLSGLIKTAKTASAPVQAAAPAPATGGTPAGGGAGPAQVGGC